MLLFIQLNQQKTRNVYALLKIKKISIVTNGQKRVNKNRSVEKRESNFDIFVFKVRRRRRNHQNVISGARDDFNFFFLSNIRHYIAMLFFRVLPT